MGWFEQLVSMNPLQPFMEKQDGEFIEQVGWREILHKVKQLKNLETLLKIIQEAAPLREKEKIILGYLYTMAAEISEPALSLPCVDYAGCYLSRGVLRLKNPSEDCFPNFVGLGMNARASIAKIQIQGNVGDYLGYRSPCIDIELEGSARDRVCMAVGDGTLRVSGDVLGSLAGGTQSVRIQIDGSAGRINPNNRSCTMLISENVHWAIGENQSDCFIKVCGNVGMKFKKSGKIHDVAAGLNKNSILLIGGDVYGNLGKGMELAKIFVWGRVHGDAQASDTEGGFIYLNKKSASILKRMKRAIGGDIGVKYVTLKNSGYLFVEERDEIQDLIMS